MGLTDEEALDLINSELNEFLATTLNGELLQHPDLELLKVVFRNGVLQGILLVKQTPEIANNIS